MGVVIKSSLLKGLGGYSVSNNRRLRSLHVSLEENHCVSELRTYAPTLNSGEEEIVSFDSLQLELGCKISSGDKILHMTDLNACVGRELYWNLLGSF